MEGLSAMKNEDYKFEVREKEVRYTTQQIQIHGEWFSSDEIMELISDLNDGASIRFHNATMERCLMAIHAVKYAWGGGYEASPTFAEFASAVKRSLKCD